MKFIFKPREWDPQGERLQVGYVPPILDRCEQPLIYPELVDANNPRATRVITAGEVFETDDRYMIAFCKAHRSFRIHWGS